MNAFGIASPPRARPVPYKAPLGTRWEKEKASMPRGTFDFPEDPEVIGPWIIGECLGKGASGRVKVAQNSETGQMAAVKILPLEAVISSRLSMRSKDAKAEKHRNGIDKEIIMMKLMNHPNIVRIYDVFEGETELYLILEYVDGGELFDYLVNNGKMDPIKALCFFKQIIYGLNYAHTFSIIHRDLKPENILIQSIKPPHIKIADWGMAAFAPPSHQLETSCGSPHYASPEIVNGRRYSGTSTDIWSCGVILFALLTGRLPFDDKNIKNLLGKVKNGRYEVPSFVQADAADLIRRMLVVDSERRITMAEILAHPYLQLATPGITYVPAPPIADLDRPLRSAAYIKSDLARSLLVICVGASYDDIIPELLSPPGQGSIIKALYYLLAKHREQTLEEYGNIEEVPECNIRHYKAPPPKKNRESTVLMSDLASVLDIGATRQIATPTLPSPAPSTLAPQSPGSSAMRSRPPSPMGPRSPRVSTISSPKPRPLSSPVPPPARSSGREASERSSGLETPIQPPTQPSAAKRRTRTQTVDGLPDFSRMSVVGEPNVERQELNDGMPRRRATLHSPNLKVNAPTLPPVAMENDASWFVRPPSVVDQHLQRAMDDIAGKINVMVAQDASDSGTNAEKRRSVDLNGSPTSETLGGRKIRASKIRMRKADKEFRYSHANAKSVFLPSDEQRPTATVDHDKENHSEQSDGKSLTSGSADGSFMKIEAETKAEEQVSEVKGKKHRAAGSRFRHSVIADQHALHAPAVVGEFKGWFANLFNWKAQQYTLHSTDSCVVTREEATRLLESFGCQVSLDDSHGWGALRCRFDETAGSALENPELKSVRFRVEFSAILGYTRQPTLTSSALTTSTTTEKERDIGSYPMSPGAGNSGLSSKAASRMSAKNMTPFASTMVLVQEKGALSTFRHMYQRLRNEWGREPLRSPEIGGAVPLTGTPRLK
ncbi:Pkinase-domain-containing protein [Schizopora paradoxa]|uniref:Pkinase-domain-containing protein n=1 Tax=Schizopora paradoxa TaxID=27342 RepID=A0A0H2RXY2_9AGAM|nr:Pkinase-domain-containing protein [Schizopora paradoxa]